MKLRTVLNELECSAWEASEEGLLDRNIMVSPHDWRDEGGDALTLRCADVADYHAAADYPERAGVLLLYGGKELDRSRLELPHSAILVASPLPYPVFRARFASIPERYGRLDIKKELLFDAFQDTYNIQQFTRRAYRILGNPIIVVNIDQRILATAGRFPESRSDIAGQIGKGYVAENVREQMAADGVIDDARHIRHSYVRENRQGQRWVTSIVYYKNLELGRFDVMEENEPITYPDLELIDFASRLAGIIIDRSGYTGQNSVNGASVLTDLLSGSFLTEQAVRQQIALTRLPLGRVYLLMLVEGQQTFGSPNYRSHIGQMARKVFPEGIWVSFKESFVMLVPLRDKANDLGLPDYRAIERDMEDRRDLAEMLEHNGLRACFSEPFDNLLACRMRFSQCRELADVMRDETTPGDRIAFFWRFRYRILASIAPSLDVVDMMMDKRVTALHRYDKEHGTAYLETALAALSFPSNPTEAAEKLAIHRNTYFYRIKQLDHLFHLDMKDPNDRLACAFTSRVMQGLPEE